MHNDFVVAIIKDYQIVSAFYGIVVSDECTQRLFETYCLILLRILFLVTETKNLYDIGHNLRQYDTHVYMFMCVYISVT